MAQRISSITPVHFPKLASFWGEFTMDQMACIEQSRFTQAFADSDTIKFYYQHDQPTQEVKLLVFQKAFGADTEFQLLEEEPPVSSVSGLYYYEVDLTSYTNSIINLRLMVPTVGNTFPTGEVGSIFVNQTTLDISDPINVVPKDDQGRVISGECAHCHWKLVTYSSECASFFAGLGPTYGDLDAPNIIHQIRMPICLIPNAFPNTVQVQENAVGESSIYTAESGIDFQIDMIPTPFWMRNLLNLVTMHHNFHIEGIAFRYKSEVQNDEFIQGLAGSTVTVSLAESKYKSDDCC